jgi:hypothetical protein
MLEDFNRFGKRRLQRIIFTALQASEMTSTSFHAASDGRPMLDAGFD